MKENDIEWRSLFYRNPKLALNKRKRRLIKTLITYDNIKINNKFN